MGSYYGLVTRHASTSITARSVIRPVVGARMDTSSRYTDTGGSGLDSTTLSSSAEQQAAAVKSLYRSALREIPALRANYTIVEDESFVKALIRDLFSVPRPVMDRKVVDMLIFKARQELGEVKEQFKGRHQVGVYIKNYHEKLALQEAAHVSEESSHHRPLRGSVEADAPIQTKIAMLTSWRKRGLVPADLQTWPQYERWKADENEKFAKFAIDANFFSPSTLEMNSKMKNQCSIM